MMALTAKEKREIKESLESAVDKLEFNEGWQQPYASQYKFGHPCYPIRVRVSELVPGDMIHSLKQHRFRFTPEWNKPKGGLEIVIQVCRHHLYANRLLVTILTNCGIVVMYALKANQRVVVGPGGEAGEWE